MRELYGQHAEQQHAGNLATFTAIYPLTKKLSLIEFFINILGTDVLAYT